MPHINLTDVAGGYNLTAINSNFQTIESHLNNNVLNRTNPTNSDNTVNVNIDMNGKRLFNLPAPLSPNEPARLIDVQSGGGGGGTNTTNLSTTLSSSSVTINSDTGTDATIPAADGTNAGVMVPSQVTKLAGVATGATANSADSFLLNRSNHTGTQTASTINDFGESVDDRVAGLLVAGTNISLAYNDTANTLTINSTGSGGGSGANLTTTLSATNVIVNSDTGTDATIPAADGTNAGVMLPAQVSKLSGIAAGATVNDTDANLKNRANHTGTQLASTISDFNEATDDRVASLLVAGTNVTLNYNDTAGTLTINSSASGTGDVVGPASSVANTLPRFNGTTGKLLKTSGITVSDADDITLKGITETVITATTSTGSYPVDTSLGTIFRIVIGANTTFTFPSIVSGKPFTLMIIQSGSTAYTVTLPSTVRPIGYAVSTSLSSMNILSFIPDSNSGRWIRIDGPQGLSLT